MFDDDRQEQFDNLGVLQDDSEIITDIHTHPDPFGCPCCASVFAETLKLTDIDLGDHGRTLVGAPETIAPPVLLLNATMMTMNTASPAADAMLVEDGRIQWIGKSEDVPTDVSSEAIRIDLQGKVVLPGFIEPHMHLAPIAMLQQFENIGPFRYPTMQGALDRLKEIADAETDKAWVLGRQFDPSLQEGPEQLTSQMLDEVSEDKPVFVYNASLHFAYCNTKALNLAGITADTEDPPGSQFGRDENGEPNGVLKGGPAMGMVGRHNPMLKDQNLAENCLDVFRNANTVGFTTVCDQGTGLFQGIKELDLYQGLRDSNRMTARLRYSLGNPVADQWDALGTRWGDGDEWIRVAGWKIVSDGSNQGRTGLQREPFMGTDSRGLAYIEIDALEEAIETRLRKGWAVVVHANGDAAIDRVLDAFERARSLGLDPGERRCRIEHCSILHDEQIERIRSLGLSPSFLIGHVHYWGQAFVDDLFGLEKAERLDRTASCEAAGIRWTLHSDDPVTEMGPLRCIENAVTRNMWRSDDILAERECIPVDAALRAMTIDAAWQCHSDHEIGSLEVGKFADFVVLDENPREVEPARISTIKVKETWVNGKLVYQD